MSRVIPDLSGVLTPDLVQTIGTGNFKAEYVNWSRTMHLLRQNAPGWLPELVPATDGGIVHKAPQGAFLLIRFSHPEHGATPAVPQAIMDHHNKAIPIDKITARDITDTHRRGACLAAALTFGLAFELWAKLPVENGYREPEPEPISDEAEAKQAEFSAAIEAADSTEALAKIGAEIAKSGLPALAIKNLKASYAQRQRALKEAA